MMSRHEIGRGCGFDVDFADYQARSRLGLARDQVDGFGNAVSPAGRRMDRLPAARRPPQRAGGGVMTRPEALHRRARTSRP